MMWIVSNARPPKTESGDLGPQNGVEKGEGGGRWHGGVAVGREGGPSALEGEDVGLHATHQHPHQQQRREQTRGGGTTEQGCKEKKIPRGGGVVGAHMPTSRAFRNDPVEGGGG